MISACAASIYTSLRIFLSTHYWSNQFQFKKFFGTFFSVCGSAAAGIEATKKIFELFKSPDQINWITTQINTHQEIITGWIALIAFLVAIYLFKPTISISERLTKRDLNIKIEIGDLFSTNQTLVIGTNTTFDTSLSDNLISENSIQGKFTNFYYGSAINHLDTDLNSSLQGVASSAINRNDKQKGKLNLYPIGTVAKVNVKQRDAYLVAMANMNSHGVAASSLEDVQTALSSLWLYISEKGGGLPNLRLPILGTGFGKIVETRQEVIKEILKSFVAACASDRFCDSLTIVISIDDYLQHRIDLSELGEFLKFLTKYTDMRSAKDIGAGTAIST